MEIKKSNSAQLEDKRVTFFLLGLLLAFTFIFVGLQYQRGQQGDDDLSESMEDLSQDLEMSARPDQKDMVSADRKSTRLNSSHIPISYAVFCLKKSFFNDTATTEIYTLSLHDALPI